MDFSRCALASSWAALIAAGEEALHRGVIYEEISQARGPNVAKLADLLLFPAVHLPADLRSGLGAGPLILNAAYQAAMTLIFDLAYDRGGLPLASASHLWSDFLLLVARWAAYGGAPP